MYKLIIFDLDGTLFNTKRGVVAAVRQTVRQAGLWELSEQEYDSYIGPPMQQSFMNTYGLYEEDARALANRFREIYSMDGYLLQIDEYDGMRDTLKKLFSDGVHLALATYKREDMAVKICRHFGYDRLIRTIHGSDAEGRRTKQDIIRICMEEHPEIGKDQVVMVGDSEYDAMGAKEAEVDFIGVTYGFGFRDKEEILQYEGAKAIDRPGDLIPFTKEEEQEKKPDAED